MLLCSILWTLVWTVARAAQFALGEGEPGQNPVPTRTIIDILSESPQYSTLLRLLQQHGLVPTINSSWNITLLAPVNSAFVELDPAAVSTDDLLYLIVNETLVLDKQPGRLLFPTFLVNDGVAAQIELRDDRLNHGQSVIIERNLMGSPDRGIVHGISNMLAAPDSVCSESFRLDDISIFTQLASLGDMCSLIGDSITMFIPTNKAMQQLYNSIELTYLFSGSSSQDRHDLLRRHTLDYQLGVLSHPKVLTMMDGSHWSVDTELTFNDTFKPIQAYICASNGIFNVFDSVIGRDVITFTPEKYILALRGFAFVRALKLYGYGYLIDGSTSTPQTLVVPVLSPTLACEHAEDLPHEALNAVRGPAIAADDNDLLYQVFSRFDLNSTHSHCLLETFMPLKSGKYRQKAHLTSSNSGRRYINWQPLTSDEYEIGNTSILTIDGRLSPPARLQMAVGPLLLGSYSLTYLDTLGLLDLPTDHSWTVMLPTRDAWEKQILVKHYFDTHPEALQQVFDSLILRTPLYSTSDAQTVRTITGSELAFRVLKDHSPSVSFALDDKIVRTEVSDVLFDNGVVHCITDLHLSPNFEINSYDLIMSGHRDVFVGMLRKCGLSYVLDPTAGNFTIIVPDSKALATANYTLDSSPEDLLPMLKLHIIENNPIEDLKDGDIYESLGGEPTYFQKINNEMYSISLVYGKGQRVFISGWGNTNGYESAGSTVLFIDSMISPSWLQQPILRPPFRLNTHTLLLMGIVLGLIICGLFAVAAIYIFLDDKVLEQTHLLAHGSREASIEPDAEEPDERPASQPIRTTGVAQGREFGQHLNLP